MSFLSSYIEHTKLYESPTSFWKWSGYTAIASVLRDQVYHKQGDDKMYPNIFVLYLAGSGQRKARPVGMCEGLVKAINNTKIISGRSSIQAIVAELARAETDPKTGKLIKGGSAVFFAGELSAAIVGDSQNIPILTDIYDFKEDYANMLIGRGKQNISKVVFSMLAASNEELLKAVYERGAVHGGLLARTFLITPNEWRESNSLLDMPDMSNSYNECITKLRTISELKGVVSVEQPAKDEYNSWYKSFRMSFQGKSDKTGILNRLHTGVFKLSILLAANCLSLQVKKHHIQEAIEESLVLIPNYNTFVMSTGKSTISDAGSTLLKDLYKSSTKSLSRLQIIQEHWNDFDHETLDNAVTTLETGGIIITIMIEGRPGYQLTETGLAMMEGRK